jgi:hypothetical protein
MPSSWRTLQKFLSLDTIAAEVICYPKNLSVH